MTKHKAERITQGISRAMHHAGLHGVVVDMDQADICYLAGNVASTWHEAEAVQIAYDCGAATVIDGLTPPGHLAPHIAHPYLRLPLTGVAASSDLPLDDAQRLLGTNLSHRLFDASGRLTIHSPVGIAS